MTLPLPSYSTHIFFVGPIWCTKCVSSEKGDCAHRSLTEPLIQLQIVPQKEWISIQQEFQRSSNQLRLEQTRIAPVFNKGHSRLNLDLKASYVVDTIFTKTFQEPAPPIQPSFLPGGHWGRCTMRALSLEQDGQVPNSTAYHKFQRPTPPTLEQWGPKTLSFCLRTTRF